MIKYIKVKNVPHQIVPKRFFPVDVKTGSEFSDYQTESFVESDGIPYDILYASDVIQINEILNQDNNEPIRFLNNEKPQLLSESILINFNRVGNTIGHMGKQQK